MRTAELTLQNDLMNTLNEFLKDGSFSKSTRYWWRTEVSSLRKMENSRSKYKQKIATDTIDYLCSYCYEAGKESLIKGKIDLAINIYRLGTLLLPESKYFYQQLSKISAFGNNYKHVFAMQEDSSNLA